jgi:flagellar motility protein MotE (MotC chaperone)
MSDDAIMDDSKFTVLQRAHLEQKAEIREILNTLRSIETMLKVVYEHSQEQAESFARTDETTDVMQPRR